MPESCVKITSGQLIAKGFGAPRTRSALLLVAVDEFSGGDGDPCEKCTRVPALRAAEHLGKCPEHHGDNDPGYDPDQGFRHGRAIFTG